MKIAVLVPVYNAERYLRECLDSLLVQGVDVFCCDDGSTDGSRAILEEYEAKAKARGEGRRSSSDSVAQPVVLATREHTLSDACSRVASTTEERALRSSPSPLAFASSSPSNGKLSVISQANAGVVAARNRLMDELPPEYEAFAFCDADDYVRDGMYARLAEAMERTGADVAESGMREKEVFHETVVDDMSIYVLRRTAPKQWVNVVNKLYRRSAVGSIRFRKGLRFEEDFFFNYEVNAAIRRKVLVPGVDYVYRTNPDSATVTLNLRRYFDSASERIRLSCEVFWKAGRIPERLRPEWLAELSKDAYRMCLRKNLKKNRDPALRRELFREAGAFFAKLERDYGFVPTGLNLMQRAIWACCRRGWLAAARGLAFLT